VKKTPFTKAERLLTGVGHALDALELLARAGGQLGLAELSRALGMSKPGAHRLLATLVARGYVERRAAGRYRLALRVWELGRGVSELGIVARAAPFMEELTRRTDESAILGVLSGRETVYLYRTETAQPVRVHTEVGSRLPAHCTSTGLALLAALPEVELADLLPAQLEALSGASITSHDALRRELAATRARGYAINVGGWRLDVAGVAAAIHDETGRASGALCIAAPRYRVTRARLRTLGRTARETADRIGVALAGSAQGERRAVE
jgi:DNA-binding IclR family transcriptional regulator